LRSLLRPSLFHGINCAYLTPIRHETCYLYLYPEYLFPKTFAIVTHVCLLGTCFVELLDSGWIHLGEWVTRKLLPSTFLGTLRVSRIRWSLKESYINTHALNVKFMVFNVKEWVGDNHFEKWKKKKDDGVIGLLWSTFSLYASSNLLCIMDHWFLCHHLENLPFSLYKRKSQRVQQAFKFWILRRSLYSSDFVWFETQRWRRRGCCV